VDFDKEIGLRQSSSPSELPLNRKHAERLPAIPRRSPLWCVAFPFCLALIIYQGRKKGQQQSGPMSKLNYQRIRHLVASVDSVIEAGPGVGNLSSGSVQKNGSPQLHGRLFCVMMHLKKSASVRRHEARVARSTWGPHCDGILLWDEMGESFESNRMSIEEEPKVYVTTADDRWLRTQRMWRHIVRNYMEHFDWFVVFDYSGFPVAENLRLLISSYAQNQIVISSFFHNKTVNGTVEVREPLLMCDRSQVQWGYVINKAAAHSFAAFLISSHMTSTKHCPEPSHQITGGLWGFGFVRDCLVMDLGVRVVYWEGVHAVRRALCDDGQHGTIFDLKVDGRSKYCSRAVMVYMVPDPDWMLDIHEAIYG